MRNRKRVEGLPKQLELKGYENLARKKREERV
jgi:hypothetical protein